MAIRDVAQETSGYSNFLALQFLPGRRYYYFVTVILVPLLSPSGSWFLVASYVAPLSTTLLTLKLTLLVFLLIRPLVIEHLPVLSVVHETVLVK